MTVETPERVWNDPRLDDLSKKVDAGFANVDAGFARVDADIREVRGDVRGLRRELLAAAIIIIGVLIKANGL